MAEHQIVVTRDWIEGLENKSLGLWKTQYSWPLNNRGVSCNDPWAVENPHITLPLTLCIQGFVPKDSPKQGSYSTAVFTTEKKPHMWTGWVQTHVVQGSTVKFPMHTAVINLKSIMWGLPFQALNYLQNWWFSEFSMELPSWIFSAISFQKLLPGFMPFESAMMNCGSLLFLWLCSY